MTIRKAAIMLALALLLAASADPASARFRFSFGDDRIDGSGDMETRSFDLEDFDSIQLDGGMDLNISFGRTTSVEVTLDDNLMDNLILEVAGGRLLIDWEESCDTDRDTHMDIVLPKLESLVINGAGDVDIRGMKADSFEFDLSGACDLDIEGKVDYLEIDLHGAGDINARDLEAKEVECYVSGAGDVDLTVSEKIDARISGVGKISYWGDPEDAKTRVSGIGVIDRK
jgi:putative autotransporter adhesin-like protein